MLVFLRTRATRAGKRAGLFFRQHFTGLGINFAATCWTIGLGNTPTTLCPEVNNASNDAARDQVKNNT
ncbi:hypothetical protein KCP75_18080 [Salmonella enterica subsp. enterica]|nr:hypothetical protein KCP75_18080 [Salmonella enterica subsp. enterica]